MFSRDYVYGISALFSDVIFLSLFFGIFFEHTNLICIIKEHFCDGLLIFREIFITCFSRTKK